MIVPAIIDSLSISQPFQVRSPSPSVARARLPRAGLAFGGKLPLIRRAIEVSEAQTIATSPRALSRDLTRSTVAEGPRRIAPNKPCYDCRCSTRPGLPMDYCGGKLDRPVALCSHAAMRTTPQGPPARSRPSAGDFARSVDVSWASLRASRPARPRVRRFDVEMQILQPVQHRRARVALDRQQWVRA